jgi:hypothetical protein
MRHQQGLAKDGSLPPSLCRSLCGRVGARDHLEGDTGQVAPTLAVGHGKYQGHQARARLHDRVAERAREVVSKARRAHRRN